MAKKENRETTIIAGILALVIGLVGLIYAFGLGEEIENFLSTDGIKFVEPLTRDELPPR